MDLLVKRCSRAAYPWEAQLRCWEGTTMVEQHFGEDGARQATTVAISSGRDVLDQGALALVESVKLNLPPALRGKAQSITTPIKFTLANRGCVTPTATPADAALPAAGLMPSAR
jgi:TonB family protein